ncbi:hypothetical protein HHK36_031319 [Tetracentron sinense]|uniref:RRM domain-containing protein n=1 Tax=Tetracentron sinense TaxID=13715 RepID=A0A834Y9B2_TETSI|nr:hypothetical protein HHK36_031319 [Tetracentron sinense]
MMFLGLRYEISSSSIEVMPNGIRSELEGRPEILRMDPNPQQPAPEPESDPAPVAPSGPRSDLTAFQLIKCLGWFLFSFEMASADVEYRCFVGGLAWATDDQALEKAFSHYGEIIESKVCSCRCSSRIGSDRFGFVDLFCVL